MRHTVAVFHNTRSFSPLDLIQRIGDSMDVVWVLESPEGFDEATTRLLRRLGTVLDITGLSHDEAARALGELSVDGIVSFVDDHLLTAAALAERLGLRYHTMETALKVADKCRQRAALHAAGVPGPAFWPIPGDIGGDELADLARRVRYPAVLKPARGSGSRGIVDVASASELVSQVAPAVGGPGFLVEEYLDDVRAEGRWYASYFSIESVVSAGVASHVAITGRFPLAPPFRETGNFLPGILAPHLEAPVLAMVERAIEALGVTDAVIHTEIKLTPQGPMLIEVNGRLGGRPPFVLETVSDVNLFETACALAVGEPYEGGGLAPCQGVGFWLMLQPPVTAHRLCGVEGLDELADLPEIDHIELNRRPGAAVDWTAGTESRVVTVRGRVADHRCLEELVDLIHHKVTLRYED